MNLYTFHWPNAIGFIEAKSLDEAMSEAKLRWCRPYHTKKNDKGEQVWYDILSEATIEESV